LDFDSKTKTAVNSINQTINGLHKVFVYHAQKEIKYSGKEIAKNDFFSLENNEKILCVDETIEKVCLHTVQEIVEKKGCSVVTIVYAAGIAEEFVEYLSGKIYELNIGVDVAIVCSMETAYSLILAFE
jgi:dihydroxyacetone kinase-like predicted kinase